MAVNRKRDFVLSQKSSNARTASNDPTRKFNHIPQMSPEARRAMGMVREDAKENLASPALATRSVVAMLDSDIQSSAGASLDNNNNENMSQSRNLRKGDTGRQKGTSSVNRVQMLPPRYAKPPMSKSTVNNPARSRSTLSHTDPPFSTSDNTESCNQTTTASSASVYTNNNSSSNNNNYYKTAANIVEDDYIDDAEDDDDDDADEVGSFPVDQDFANGNATLRKEKSFVLALDRALERNAISRLRGDITDTTRIHEPGTVRALDGGRLANAQEVVVNVCHDDDRQLVFHDDDEESLDTAKEISQIRVNIWMEYNSTFPPDNDIHDFQIHEDHDDQTSQRRPLSGTLTRPSGDKTVAGSRKTPGNNEGKTNSLKDKNARSKSNVNEKSNKNIPLSIARQKTQISIPKSARSGSSGSSRGPSQNDVPLTKRAPSKTRTKR